MKKVRASIPVPLKKVKVTDPFWGGRQETVRNRAIPHQWDALNDRLPDMPPSHVISDLRKAGGSEKGDFQGILFQDSDLAKWLETLSYRLATHPDDKWLAIAEEVIDLLESSQQEDGYINSYFTVARPEDRWTNLRDRHELYVAGHLIEAAVAYYEATGRKKFLDLMCRFADYIGTVFGLEEGKKRGYPGHEEIELALIKLYRTTGNRRYLDLCKYFINERGSQPCYFTIEAEEREEEPVAGNSFRSSPYTQYQAHLPVREQNEAVGHSVRAMYLYCGMADLAIETADHDLAEACRRLWGNVTRRRMYVTGGVGSSAFGEAFTFDSDLPNDRAYTETCAAVGLVFWAHRMLQLDTLGEYGDVMERALYNGVLSGISLDGEKYFYVNPLEVWPEACAERSDLKHVKRSRRPWFGCACCPPNISRLLASLGGYIYSTNKNELFVHLYMGSETAVELEGGTVRLTQETGYPWKEEVQITVGTEKPIIFSLGLRIPGWCRNPHVKLNGEDADAARKTSSCYLKIRREWKSGDVVDLTFPMPVERIRSHPEVRANAGKAAIRRGPLIYCLEEIDNGCNLPAVSLPKDTEFSVDFKADLLGGINVISGQGVRTTEEGWEGCLYSQAEQQNKPISIVAVPYYAWANRGSGEMIVWIRES